MGKNVRQAAVAGFFYPGNETVLHNNIRQMLAETKPSLEHPKLMIAPHAGYIYSGPVAASAYALLQGASEKIQRVVLLGPSHRLFFEGVAFPSHDAFSTPLGDVPLDRNLIREVMQAHEIQPNDLAHRDEHSLEVHLPFLQSVLKDFSLVPMLAGQVSPEIVAELLQEMWGGEETLIVCSTDLSHYLEYNHAQRMDQKTSEAIVSIRPEQIAHENACGGAALKGALLAARKNGLQGSLVDLRNSGDTAGDKTKVVGYGAYAFYAA